MYLPGRIFLISVLVAILGFIVLVAIDQITSAPFAILLGTFIIGFATREVKHGAIVGLFVAGITTVVFIIILAIVFFISIIFVISLVLLFFFEIIWALVRPIFIYFIYVIVLSPIFGAVGGFSGRLILGPKKEIFPQAPSTQIKLDYTNKIVCMYCGAPNDPSNKFCFNCGKSLGYKSA